MEIASTPTIEQIHKFNKEMLGKAFLIKEPKPACEYMLLWKHYAEEDPDEDLSPFTSKEEALSILRVLSIFCGGSANPDIKERKK